MNGPSNKPGRNRRRPRTGREVPTRTDSRYETVDKHGGYLYAHLDRDTAFTLLDLDAWPGHLVPLHRAGCTPDELRAYRAAGITVDEAIAFRTAGWDAAYVAATGAAPQAVLGYLRLGVTDIVAIRRLAAAPAGPGQLAALTRGGPLLDALAGLDALDRAPLTLDGAFGPVRLVIEDGALLAATEQDRDDLEDEMGTGLLGGRIDESPALRLIRLMAGGLDAPWEEIAAVLGLPDDRRTVALRWVKAVLDAPESRHDGVRPRIALLSPAPPCSACAERDAFVAAREAAYLAELGRDQ